MTDPARSPDKTLERPDSGEDVPLSVWLGIRSGADSDFPEGPGNTSSAARGGPSSGSSVSVPVVTITLALASTGVLASVLESATGPDELAVLLTLLSIGLFGGGLFLIAPFLARTVAIPLGLPQLAWTLRGFGLVRADEHRLGGAVVAGALASIEGSRRSGLPPRALPFLHTRLREAAQGPQDVSGEVILAAGLLAICEQREDEARFWLTSVADIPPWATSIAGRQLAAQWRTADAITRGAWERAQAIAAPHRGRAPLVQFLGSCAGRIAGLSGAAEPEGLLALWHGLDDRDSLRPLLDRATAAVDPLPRVLEQGLAATSTQELIITHLRVLAGPYRSPRPDLIATLACAWSRVPELDELGFRTEIEQDLLSLARFHGVPELHLDDDPPALLAAVRRHLEGELLGELEHFAGALRGRTAARTRANALDEWRAAIDFIARYRRVVALCGASGRRYAFHVANVPLSHYAVWLDKTATKRTFAHAIFYFLLVEARFAGAEREIATYNRNCEITASPRSP